MDRSGLVRWLLDVAWSQGQTDELDHHLGDITFHHGGAEIRIDGHDLATLIADWRTGFPDLTFEVCDLVEQADLVAVRARARGTHLGAWRGRPASGRRIDYDVALFFRWEGGRLAEVWEVDDRARREQQLTPPSLIHPTAEAVVG